MTRDRIALGMVLAALALGVAAQFFSFEMGLDRMSRQAVQLLCVFVGSSAGWEALRERGFSVRARALGVVPAVLVALGLILGLPLARSIEHAATRDREERMAGAVIRGDADEVATLVAGGVDPSAFIGANGGTALFFAAHEGNAELVRVLLDAGAEVERGSTRGMTPLMAATMAGEVEVVRLLLEAGANPTARSPNGLSVVDMAAGSPEIRALLER